MSFCDLEQKGDIAGSGDAGRCEMVGTETLGGTVELCDHATEKFEAIAIANIDIDIDMYMKGCVHDRCKYA